MFLFRKNDHHSKRDTQKHRKQTKNITEIDWNAEITQQQNRAKENQTEMEKKGVNNKRWIVNEEKDIKKQSWSNRGVK